MLLGSVSYPQTGPGAAAGQGGRGKYMTTPSRLAMWGKFELKQEMLGERGEKYGEIIMFIPLKRHIPSKSSVAIT